MNLQYLFTVLLLSGLISCCANQPALYFAPRKNESNSANILGAPLVGITRFIQSRTHQTPQHSWTKQDFEKYFQRKFGNYCADLSQQRQILQQYDLYDYSGFCDFIKEIPGWQDHLDEVSAALRADAELHKKSAQPISLQQDLSAPNGQYHVISDNAVNFLIDNGYRPQAYKYFSGSAEQLQVHKQCLQLVEKASVQEKIWTPKSGRIFLSFVDCGREHNAIGSVAVAKDILRVCHDLFDCFTAIGEGIIDGSLAVANNVIHPIETAKNIATSIRMLARGIAQLTLYATDLVVLKYTDQLAYEDQKLVHNCQFI